MAIGKDKRKTTENSLLAASFIILQSLFYGFGDPISKVAYETTPVFTLCTLRYSIAFIILFVLFRRRVIKSVKTVPVRAWLVPGLCIAAAYLIGNIALAMTEATSVAFIRSLSVVLTPLFAFLIYRTHYKWQHIAIQITALAGLYLLCAKGGLSGFGIGEALVLLDASLRACALVFSKRYLDDIDPVSLTTLQAGCSAILALGGSLIAERGVRVAQVNTQSWLIILYLAITCTLLGYLLQNLALTRISDRAVALLQSTAPVMTAVFSFIILGEQLSVAGIAGSVIILLCVIVSSIIP